MTDFKFRIMWLRERFKWMGKHSGYDRVCNAIASLNNNDDYTSIWREPGKPLPRGSHRLFSLLPKRAKYSPFYAVDSAVTEIEALWKSLYKRPQCVHITYAENNLGILPDLSKIFSFKTVGTVHQQPAWWKANHLCPERISVLDGLIVLASQDVVYFEQFMPGRVFFIPHGVDTVFFCPLETEVDYPRCVFSGQYQRDFKTLAEVIARVSVQNPQIKFDLIVPKDKRNHSSLSSIMGNENVFWYAGISDEQLLQIYQQASMLFLPLLDCTANNALVEAIACGLPVVSNSVGGIGDYTQDTFADLFAVGDVERMSQAVLRLAQDKEERKKRGMAARSFARQNLSWERVAVQTLEVYSKVLSK